jgi:hypothetical protein
LLSGSARTCRRNTSSPNCSASAKLKPLRRTASDRGWPTQGLANTILKAAKPLFEHRLTRRGQFQAQLETAPDRTVEQFGMVAGDDGHDVAWQGINLHQEGTDDALNLPGLVGIASFLA